jgi:hypothetical protein
MIADLTTGGGIGCASHNGRFRAVSGSKSPERNGWELVTLAMLRLAVEQTKILCRYGLIKRNGDLLAWPRVKTFRDGYRRSEPMNIAGMSDPLEHARLREFWNDKTQAQSWCDLVNFNVPAKDIWTGILKNNAK